MSDYADTQRKFDEVDYEYTSAMATEAAKLPDEMSDELRAIKATLATPKELRDRRAEALSALNAATREIDERMVKAHEDLAVLRQGGVYSGS